MTDKTSAQNDQQNEQTDRQDAAQHAPAAESAPPARRRRASRPAAAPVDAGAPADAPQQDTLPGVEAAATSEEPVTEQPAAAPKRRRSTRATKAAAEPVVAEAAPEQSAAAPEEPAAEPAQPADGDAPTKPARRRRAATRPVAAPEAVAQVATEAAAEAATGAAAEAASEAPVGASATTAEQPTEQPTELAGGTPEDAPATAPRRRSRRATKPAAEPVEAPAPDAVAPSDDASEIAEDELADETEDATAVAAATEGASAVPAETAPPAPAPATQKPATSPRLATTALLFQAPDPTQARPRRRRVTSSAGSPEEISQAARQAQEAEEAAAALAAAERADETTDATTDAAAGGAAGAPEPDEPRGRGRRSRRGRGGRGRSADEAAEQTDEAGEVSAARSTARVADAQGAVEDDAAEGAGDETGTDESTTDESITDETATDENGADDNGTDENGDDAQPRRRRRRGGRGRRRGEAGDRADERSGDGSDDDATDDQAADEPDDAAEGEDGEDEGGSSRRRRRRRRGARSGEAETEPRRRGGDEVTALRGSTRLEAKRQRRREGRDAGRRRQIITEAEFLARRESVERSMIVREKDGRTQIAVLEDGVLVEHYVSNQQQASMVGNVYLGRVQNVLPSMEAAFVDVGKGRNAVLYAGEVNWDAAGLEGQPRRIEQALKSGDSVLVQVTKDPIGHKGARLTSQVTLAGRYLVYVPGGGMTGISRKLPDTERNRLKKILREVVPDSAGVIVRTAAEGASEEELRADIARLQSQWEAIEKKSKTASAPALLQGEPDMAIRVVRDIFNDDFSSLVVQGGDAWSTISSYIDDLAPDLAQKVSRYAGTGDVFAAHRIDEQLAKGMDRKVWLPSGGSLVIDRTEAMTVVDVNTGKFTGSGGTLEETVTRNNLEAAEEIVRQLRLRDIGGIIVIDFIDMVLESNRDLVLRRLVECLGRDRTKHQVAEVTSLGLVQMTRKRVGQGLVEAFSETCEHCHGRGFIVHSEPVEKGARPEQSAAPAASPDEPKRARRKRGAKEPAAAVPHAGVPVLPEERSAVKATLATIAAAAAHAHELHDHEHTPDAPAEPVGTTGAASAAPASPADEVAQDVVAGPTDVPPTSVSVAHDESDAALALDEPAEPAGHDEADEAGRTGHGEPTFDVLAELATLRTEPAPAEHLELTPVDPSVFVTFDTDDSAAADAADSAAAETGDGSGAGVTQSDGPEGRGV